MIYTVTIEETVSQDFEIDASDVSEAIKLACTKYENVELTLCPGELTAKQMRAMCAITNEETEWVSF